MNRPIDKICTVLEYVLVLWVIIIFCSSCGSAECYFDNIDTFKNDGAAYSVCKDGSRVKL